MAQATIFIPIVGYLVVFNNEITGYLKLLPIFGNDASANTVEQMNLSRLICLYIGLFCIGIGSILFAIFCPSEISENTDEHEFITKELDIMTPSRFESTRQRLCILKHLGSATQKAEVDRLNGIELSDTIGSPGMRSPELQGRGLAWNEWLNRNKKEIASVSSTQYQLLDLSLWDARAVMTAFYIVGVLFLMLPSGQVFFKAVLLLSTVGQFLFRL